MREAENVTGGGADNSLENRNTLYDTRETLNLTYREQDEFHYLLVDVLAGMVAPAEWARALTETKARMGEDPWA